MSDRGMKKWAPYKALIEQEPILNKLRKEKTKVDKPRISSDEAENINDILVNYHGEELEIQYYRDGYVFNKVITIRKIDVLNKKLLINQQGVIYFNEIVSLREI